MTAASRPLPFNKATAAPASAPGGACSEPSLRSGAGTSADAVPCAPNPQPADGGTAPNQGPEARVDTTAEGICPSQREEADAGDVGSGCATLPEGHPRLVGGEAHTSSPVSGAPQPSDEPMEDAREDEGAGGACGSDGDDASEAASEGMDMDCSGSDAEQGSDNEGESGDEDNPDERGPEHAAEKEEEAGDGTTEQAGSDGDGEEVGLQDTDAEEESDGAGDEDDEEVALARAIERERRTSQARAPLP